MKSPAPIPVDASPALMRGPAGRSRPDVEQGQPGQGAHEEDPAPGRREHRRSQVAGCQARVREGGGEVEDLQDGWPPAKGPIAMPRKVQRAHDPERARAGRPVVEEARAGRGERHDGAAADALQQRAAMSWSSDCATPDSAATRGEQAEGAPSVRGEAARTGSRPARPAASSRCRPAGRRSRSSSLGATASSRPGSRGARQSDGRDHQLHADQQRPTAEGGEQEQPGPR